MAQMISFNNKKPGGVMSAMRRLWCISIPTTAVLSATAAIGFAIVLDGCSKSSKKTDVSSASSSVNSGGISKSIPTPTPALVKETVVTKKKSAVQRPANVSFVDSGSGVSFRYPREYTLMTGDKARLNSDLLERVPMNFVLPGGMNVTTIALPGRLATPLLSVNLHKGLTAGQCEQFSDPDAADIANNSKLDPSDEAIPVKVSMHGIGFTKVENGTEQTDTRYYHHFQNGACYEFVLAVAEAKDNKTPVDHFEVFDKLERILASVNIKSDVPTSTASVSSTPAGENKPQ